MAVDCVGDASRGGEPYFGVEVAAVVVRRPLRRVPPLATPPCAPVDRLSRGGNVVMGVWLLPLLPPPPPPPPFANVSDDGSGGCG